jgi:tripartite ATP-independent transporter DctP family solute receptor
MPAPFSSIVIGLFLLLWPACSTPEKEAEKRRKPSLVFRLSNELKPDSKIWDASRLFKEALAKASPEHNIAAGEIEVNFYDQGMVGSERQLLETCYLGVVEAVQVNSSVVTTIDPAYSILDLPYLFLTEEHHKTVLNGPVGAQFLQRLTKHNLLGLAFYGTGFRNIFYKPKPGAGCIEQPDDLNGLKIRVMESPTMINAINAMGASATPIPFGELYQALKTGVVDGAENSARVFISYRYDETGCSCFTLTEHFANQHIIIVNHDWFRQLPMNYQLRIQQAAKQVTAAFDSVWHASTEDALTQMQALGVQVNHIAAKKSFRQLVAPQYEQFFLNHPDAPYHLFEQINALAAQYDTP